VVAIALANKMARVAWALLARGGTYRVPVLVAALQGVMKTLMRNGRDRRSENPSWVTRGKSTWF
jgi:hypothetical protein